MKRGCLMIVAAGIGMIALLFAVSLWFAVSRMSSGYEVIDGKVYYREFNNVDFKVDRREVTGVDTTTFTTVENSGGKYGTDGSVVCFHETQLTEADPSSFRILDWRRKLSRDANHVYWRSIRMSNDPENFQILSRGYSKDTQHVYFGARVVEDAAPATFEVSGAATTEATESNHRFDIGKMK